MHRIGAQAWRSLYRARPRPVGRPTWVQRQAIHNTRPYHKDGEDSHDVPRPAGSKPMPDAPFDSESPAPANTLKDSDRSATGEEAVPGQEVSRPPSLSELAENVTPSKRRLFRRLFDVDDAELTKLISEAEQFVNEKYAGKPPEDLHAAMDALEAEANAKHEALEASMEKDTEPIPNKVPTPPSEMGFMAMGEAPEDQFPDEPYEADDITALAHAELDQKRDLRHYMRLVMWEMPQLSKFATSFELPSDRPLRFRYTTYMGESHPAENKIVVEFCTADLPLTPAQRLKLIKLVGPRYDPQKDLVKMSCESFSSQAQNKRYLGDLVDKLVSVAKGEGESAEAKDSFTDVPVDFRHVKWKHKPTFPEEWKMSAERKQVLDAKRKQIETTEQQQIEAGLVVDGKKSIEESFAIVSPVLEQGERAARTMRGRTNSPQGRGRPRDLRLS